MIPIKRESFINRYRILSDVFVFTLAATIQSPKVYHRITVDSVSVQRSIIANQSYGIFTYVSPHTWVVVLEPIVIQSRFTVFILPLVTERTIIQRTRIAKLHFFPSKKSFLGGKIPKTLANVLPKAEKRKQKKTP